MQPRCPRCGAQVEPHQEVCLHCGARLPSGESAATTLVAAWRRRLPDWLLAVLLLALVSAAATAAAVAAHSAPAPTTIVATTPGVSVGPGSTTETGATAPPASTPPQPTISTQTLPVAPGPPSTVGTTTPPPTTTPRPPRRSGGLLAWPRGRSGYTDVLESLPESAGRAAAAARADAARRAGLPDVGVLLSSEHSTLRAGYWVAFSGVYATPGQAQAGLAAARARGFPGAYPARVAP